MESYVIRKVDIETKGMIFAVFIAKFIPTALYPNSRSR